MALTSRRRQRIQQPTTNLQQNNGELPRDPDFVRTWDDQALQEERPGGQIPDGPVAQPQPFQRPETQSLQQVESIVQPPKPPVASRTRQSFEEYSRPFLRTQREERNAYDDTPYQTAYNSQLGAINQLGTNNTTQANTERQRALEEARLQAQDAQKQITESYDPKLQALRQSLSDRGILDSSEAGKQLIQLLNNTQDSTRRVEQDLQKRTQQIDETYSQRSAQIQQQTQQAVADEQRLLAQRLDALKKDKRVAEESKQQFTYQIYKEYQDELSRLDAAERQAQQDEYKMRQDALDNEIALANLTGMYQGQPTYKSQQAGIDNELAQAKYDLSLEQALAKLNKAGKSGGSGGSGGLGADSVSEGLQQVLAYQNQGLAPLDALNLVMGNYNAAGKRSLSMAFNQAATSGVPVTNSTPQTNSSILQGALKGAGGGLGGAIIGGLSAFLGNKGNNSIKINANQLKTPQTKTKKVYNDPL